MKWYGPVDELVSAGFTHMNTRDKRSSQRGSRRRASVVGCCAIEAVEREFVRRDVLQHLRATANRKCPELMAEDSPA